MGFLLNIVIPPYWLERKRAMKQDVEDAIRFKKS